jgi:TolA-binding protein
MKKIIFVISVLVTASFAERSAYGAGSLDVENPYGLSESEKIIFDNKKKIRYQDQKIAELTEQLEGMRSVVESVSEKIGRTGQRINEIGEKASQAGDDEITSIKNDISQLRQTQTDNYEKINAVLKKLSSMIDKINGNYVTLDNLSSMSVKKKSSKLEDAITPEPSKKRSSKKLSNREKLKEAIALYRKEHYTKSFPIFKELSESSYKPATTNYYLGEISYYKKQYQEAIVYYKRSVGYYDKASYMPTLLLHTGISFEKLNDKDNKNKFLDALLNSYPNSQEASMAQNHLN